MSHFEEPKLRLLPETDEARALRELSKTDPDIVAAHKTIRTLQIGAGAAIITITLASIYHKEVASALNGLGF